MDSDERTNILVVDDVPEKLLSIQTILEDLGQNVITAASGREALRRLLEREYAVVLLDVNMPDMDGFETAALIRQRRHTAHTPIIFVTAFGDEMHTAQGYSLGAVDYILSPVVPEILRTKVSVFVELYKKNQLVRRQAEERVALAREQAARAAAEEATRRSAFLAEASHVLTTSLDYEATLQGLLSLLVPHLGDLAAVVLAEEAALAWEARLVWGDGAAPTACAHAAGLEYLPPRLAEAVRLTLGSGTTQPVPEIGPWRPPHAGREDPCRTGLDLRSGVVLPLLARGKTLGAVALAMGASGRRYLASELSLAEDLAGRAAIALDNARLYRDIQEADRRKNEFLAMLSHELRNPLAPIRSAVQILRLRGQDSPEVSWARDVIDRQVQQMVRLIDDLLDVSRITRGKIRLQSRPVDVAVMVARAVETSRPLLDARRQELTVSLPPGPLAVDGDLDRLSQVVANLLNNAAKYTEEGGRVGVSAAREGDDVVLRVRDSGVGIPADMLGRVFDLFTQVDRSLDRSQGGLGIGLTLVKSLVELHGGTVRAHSDGPGHGSEFVVRLPARVEGTPGRDETGGANGAAGTNGGSATRRVLVVDDNVDAADSLALLLRLTGHEVRTSHDGPGAVEAAAAFRPDVVLLDIGLPGLDGYEVARRLRRLPALADVCLVALTGYGQEDDRRRSQEAGFDHHLVKPVDPQDVERLLGSLDQHPARAPLLPSV